jgi:hypothetical protein
MRYSSLKQRSVAKKEPQFVKLRRSVRLQIKALNKDIPYGHQWTTAFLFDGRKLFLMTVILHILRIAFANTL